MRRTFIPVTTLVILALTHQATTAQANVIFLDDFSDGNDSGWARIDLTPGRVGTFDASSGAHVLETTAAVPPRSALVSIRPDTSDPAFSNGFVRGIIRADTLGSSLNLALRLNPATFDLYGFIGTTFGSGGPSVFAIQRLVS